MNLKINRKKNPADLGCQLVIKFSLCTIHSGTQTQIKRIQGAFWNIDSDDETRRQSVGGRRYVLHFKNSSRRFCTNTHTHTHTHERWHYVGIAEFSDSQSWHRQAIVNRLDNIRPPSPIEANNVIVCPSVFNLHFENSARFTFLKWAWIVTFVSIAAIPKMRLIIRFKASPV